MRVPMVEGYETAAESLGIAKREDRRMRCVRLYCSEPAEPGSNYCEECDRALDKPPTPPPNVVDNPRWPKLYTVDQVEEWQKQSWWYRTTHYPDGTKRGLFP